MVMNGSVSVRMRTMPGGLHPPYERSCLCAVCLRFGNVMGMVARAAPFNPTPVLSAHKDIVMSRYHRARVPGGIYFFTAVIERRQPILIHADVRTVLRKAIVLMPETLPFHIDGWILLADHLHAI
jgi:hypothetical protein